MLKKIKDLFNKGDVKELEEIIEVCEDSELEMMVDTAVKEKVKDRNVLGVLEDYTGLPLSEDINNNLDEAVVNTEKSDKTTKRSKKK